MLFMYPLLCSHSPLSELFMQMRRDDVHPEFTKALHNFGEEWETLWAPAVRDATLAWFQKHPQNGHAADWTLRDKKGSVAIVIFLLHFHFHRPAHMQGDVETPPSLTKVVRFVFFVFVREPFGGGKSNQARVCSCDGASTHLMCGGRYCTRFWSVRCWFARLTHSLTRFAVACRGACLDL